MRPPNEILAGYGTTIFEVMSLLARDSGAINLGQGFPDSGGPADIIEKAREALVSESNQYPPMMGLPVLRQVVAAHDRRFYGLELDWRSEVMVTSGATEALAVSFLGLLNEGDEVVVFEPLYDSYVPMIRRAGATVRSVALRPPNWELSPEELRAAFSPATAMVVLNSPLNPAGKVFSRSELEAIAKLATEFDATVVCDEVYEHLVFSGAEHVPLITLPGMRERCVRIASAGKTFSLTGWKVGMISADASLLTPIARAHQYLTFTTPPNLQHAVAFGLAKDDGYFEQLTLEMQSKRDRLRSGLDDVGFEVATCDGTYFLNARIGNHAKDGEDDVAFCRRLTTEFGVAAIPVSAFYLDRIGGRASLPANPHDQGAVTDTIRFCFAKKDATLDSALERLAKLRGSIV